jgi:hypothetical protein|tara:strand:+ start:275 stop:2470 length:2196 start_codon:yes stop_codon:yes gene_type:complete
MGATYTRQEASNITDGSVIEAAHLNNELNQLVNAFASSSGHTHDGTSAEGGFVPILADSDANNKILVDTSSNRFGVFVEVSSNPVEQVRFQDGAILPVTNNDIDLGTSSLQFKDAFFDGVITTDSLALPTTTITDILDEDNMSSNSATALATQQSIKAYVDAQITAEDLDFQADSGGALAIDLDSETLTFTGGTGIDTSGSGNAVTFAIDSTVATLAGSQTLTNKSLTAPILTGSSSAAGSILFKEDTDNGTNSVTLIGPAATADVTVTLPAATDTLVGKATTDTLTNKTIDANGTGNSITNLEVADLASGVLDTDLSSVSGSDDTLASAKAIKTYVDAQIQTEDTLAELNDTNISSLASGHILIYDGSDSFDNKAVSGDITIASTGAVTIANSAVETAMVNANVITGQTALTTGFDTTNDFLLIHDADAGSLKKISLGNISTAAGGLSDIVGDTTPQLGGNLDVNGNSIVSVSNGNISITPNGSGKVILDGLSHPTSDGSNGQFLKTDGGGNLSFASVTQATGNELENLSEDTSPQLGGNLDVNGNDIVSTSNANIDILPNGSGVVNLDGNGSSGGVSVSDGLIDIRTGTGNVSKVKFYCESSNAHAQTLQAQPHSASSSAVLTLPVATGTLVGTGDTGSVSNDMLGGSIAASKLAGSIPDSKLSTITTADKVSGAAVQIDGATDGTSITVASTDKLLVDDGGTTKYVNVSQLPASGASEGFAIALAVAL